MTFEDAAGGLVSGELQAQGFRERITDPLRTDPIAFLRRVIDYTPNTGGGVGDHDTDDNAMEYIGMVREEGAMSKLTRTQRTRLIGDLVGGTCGNDEEQAIIDLLETCSATEMAAIVRDLGDGDAEEGIDFGGCRPSRRAAAGGRGLGRQRPPPGPLRGPAHGRSRRVGPGDIRRYLQLLDA